MMTRKPGPPVPPRPNTGLLKSRSESPISRPTVVTSTSKISSSDTGRTVIYKSPSFDLKKRQQQLQQHQQEYSHDQRKQSISHEQNDRNMGTTKQKSIFVSEAQKHFRSNRVQNESSSTPSQLDNGPVTMGNTTNRTEIVIINNNKTTIKNGTDSDNNNVDQSADHDMKKVDNKVSPVPKPRTSIPSRPGSKNALDNGVIRSNSASSDLVASKSEITIKRDIIENNVNNNTKSSSKCVEKKNLEMENNIKNAAERLFTEIIVNQSKIGSETTTRTEHCISVRSTPSPPSSISKGTGNVNRTRLNLAHRPEPEGGENKATDVMNSQRSLEDKIPAEKKVAFHEILISELAAMRRKNSADTGNSNEHDFSDHDHDQIKIEDSQPKQRQQRKRYPSGCSTDSSPYGTHRSRIRTSDWVEVGDNGKEVMLTSCHISLEDSGLEDEERLDDTSSGVGDSWDSVKDAEERMSLPGLPPLPKSLSGLDSTGVPVHNSTGSIASLESQRGISPISRMTTTTGGAATTSTLDTQLAVLRREMFGLRQLDLSLLSQLWALNESIQEFRTMLQEQEALSPPSPSPSPSDANSVSSDAEDDIPLPIGKTQLPLAMQRMRSAPPPPPPTRKAPQRPV